MSKRLKSKNLIDFQTRTKPAFGMEPVPTMKEPVPTMKEPVPLHKKLATQPVKKLPRNPA